METDYCYKITWDFQSASGTQHKVMKPLYKYPDGHAMTDSSKNVCRLWEAGSAVPTEAYWSESGDTADCQLVSGVEAWYANNYPITYSANAGFEEDEAAVFYFIMNNESEVNLVQQ